MGKRKESVKRTLVVVTLAICCFSQAYASTRPVITFRDIIRPNGHKRSDAVGDAALNLCYRRTGLSRYEADTQTFKDCMLTQGYQWVSTKQVSVPPPKNDDSFIDSDTGMSCRNVGGASICEPPQGTVHYQNRHGLNCTRTGIVSVCSNL
jgi:hypothetical protein